MTEEHVMQLAGISTACFQNTESTIVDRISRDNPYWTQAYEDVCVAVDREMRERKRAEKAERERDEARAACADMREAFGMYEPYPLTSVLIVLRDAARHLLHDHNCDCLGHEKIQLQEQNVEILLQRIEHALSDDAGKGWLSPEKKAKLRKLLELVDLCCAEINGWDSIDGDEVKEALKLLEIE